MFNAELHDFCSEFYIVEKSIEVVVRRQEQSKRMRIDALRDEISGDYCTVVYEKEELTVQPTLPQENNQFSRKPENYLVWVAYVDFPWVRADSAEGALHRALLFLKERCDGK